VDLERPDRPRRSHVTTITEGAVKYLYLIYFEGQTLDTLSMRELEACMDEAFVYDEGPGKAVTTWSRARSQSVRLCSIVTEGNKIDSIWASVVSTMAICASTRSWTMRELTRSGIPRQPVDCPRPTRPDLASRQAFDECWRGSRVV
jgi:hypothetical protein